MTTTGCSREVEFTNVSQLPESLFNLDPGATTKTYLITPTDPDQIFFYIKGYDEESGPQCEGVTYRNCNNDQSPFEITLHPGAVLMSEQDFNAFEF